jgi:hypothetical protein
MFSSLILTLQFISPMSGHYRPTQEKFESFLSFFKDNGVNLDEVQVTLLQGLGCYPW